MNEAPVVVMLMVGFFAGNVIAASLVHWFVAVSETLKLPSPHRWRLAILGSFFNSGPWMLVVVGLFVYFESGAPWARWLCAGAFAWVVFVGWTAYSAWARNRKRKENAA